MTSSTATQLTDLGSIPGDWHIETLSGLGGKVTSGSRGWAKYYADHGALFVRITNLRRSNIHLDLSKNRYVRVPAGDTEAERTRLTVGDLLVSITADIGIIGYIEEGVPSPAYINQHIARVRFPSSRVSSRFIAYYLASWSPQRAFIGSTDTGAKAGMNLATVGAIRTVVPPLSEQLNIAQSLADVDDLISTLERTIAKRQAIKQGMMQQLLKGRTRLPGFVERWSPRRLSDLLSYEQPWRYLVQTARQLERGRVPVLTAGKTFVLGYTNETHGVYTRNPVIIFDDFTTASKYVDFDFKAKSSAMKILSARPETDLRFVYERMQLIDFQLGDHKRYWISEYSKLEIMVPDKAEQRAIGAVIADFDRELQAVRDRLEKAKKVKQGMMQQLLTGRIRLSVQESAA